MKEIQKNKAKILIQRNKVNWAQGIILSEVLGPPKAKKPNNTKKSLYRKTI